MFSKNFNAFNLKMTQEKLVCDRCIHAYIKVSTSNAGNDILL